MSEKRWTKTKSVVCPFNDVGPECIMLSLISSRLIPASPPPALAQTGYRRWSAYSITEETISQPRKNGRSRFTVLSHQKARKRYSIHARDTTHFERAPKELCETPRNLHCGGTVTGRYKIQTNAKWQYQVQKRKTKQFTVHSLVYMWGCTTLFYREGEFNMALMLNLFVQFFICCHEARRGVAVHGYIKRVIVCA